MQCKLPRVSTRRERGGVLEGMYLFPSVMRNKLLIEDHCRPLHGLPILVKDLIGTNDKMETAGKYPAPYQSVVLTDMLSSRLVRTRWRKSTRRFNRRGQTQRKRGYHPRQNESLGMGELQILGFIGWLECERRSDICCLHSGSDPQRKF